jgi:hypothetical protein
MTLFGLRITVALSSYPFMMLVAVIAAVLGAALLNFDAPEAIVFGVGVVIVHWGHELLHQIGHSIAARRVGHPMSGIHFWGPLGTGIYPDDEGDLPPGVHVRRALGGPIFSATVSLILGILLALDISHWANWLLFVALVEGVLIFTLGALTPIQALTGLESDGDTLLRMWRSTRQK